ncbi:MAG TPA: TMEM175 family protein [Candidatus Kapabacteria bacterium]|jgi:uncharacterized membrane protein|nr:TMEM175 family protein [Candidatus Kapabacteria bacterium]
MIERNETARIEAFSDGVFAIAITLLVLDLKVPRELPAGTTLGKALLAQWPVFAAYLTSFATIGIMWMNHHYLFTVIRRSDHSLLILNSLLLLMVTFIPFPTALLAEYYGKDGEHLAADIYAGSFFIIAIIFNVLWRYASYRNRLLGHDIDSATVEGIHKSFRFGPLLYLGALILAFLNVAASVGLCFGLAAFFALPKKK